MCHSDGHIEHEASTSADYMWISPKLFPCGWRSRVQLFMIGTDIRATSSAFASKGAISRSGMDVADKTSNQESPLRIIQTLYNAARGNGAPHLSTPSNYRLLPRPCRLRLHAKLASDFMYYVCMYPYLGTNNTFRFTPSQLSTSRFWAGPVYADPMCLLVPIQVPGKTTLSMVV